MIVYTLEKLTTQQDWVQKEEIVMEIDLVPTVFIVGGTGIASLSGFTTEHVLPQVLTPHGEPPGPVTLGSLEGCPYRVAFTGRHGGPGHLWEAGDVNFPAIVRCAFDLGSIMLVSASAVGSLSEDIHPGQIAVVENFIDMTDRKGIRFHGSGEMAFHPGLGNPVCTDLSTLLFEAVQTVEPSAKRGKTYLAIQGPAFSTSAESRLWRQWGAHLVGMTAISEAKLARHAGNRFRKKNPEGQAGMCYACLALPADWDAWKEDADPVSGEIVTGNLDTARPKALAALEFFLRSLPPDRACQCCRQPLAHALHTDPSLITPATRERLGPWIDQYLP